VTQPLSGILPVAPTPFHPDGRVDEERTRERLLQLARELDLVALRWGE
jgi:dihydrodipicolinate synthase/N-acetylneuraminate lyase